MNEKKRDRNEGKGPKHERERIGEQDEKGPRPYLCPKTVTATTAGYFGAGTAAKQVTVGPVSK